MAPIVAGLLKFGLPLLANGVLAKGADWVKDKTGVDLEQALGSEEGRIRLRQAELEHEEELLKLRLEQDRLSVELEKVFAADRASARSREVEVSTSERVPYIGRVATPLLAFGITLGFFCVLGFLLFNAWSGFTLTDGVKEVLLIMLGGLGTQWTAVCQYYFGSSTGSAQKTILWGREVK